MFLRLISFLSILAPGIHAVVHLPFSIYSVENLGITTDYHSNTEGIFHDGGGGATQNGYHVQVFADSMNKDGKSFVHNSVAYYGIWDKNDPLQLYTFGMSGPPGQAVFVDTPVGPQGNETALGSDFSIWMLSAMTPMADGKTILGVFPALKESESLPLYSTMVQMEAVDPFSLLPGATPPFTRLGSGRLFYPNEVQYGTFALVDGVDGYLYLAGADKTGIKLARVPSDPTLWADRNHYDYYNNYTKTWQPQQPLDLNNDEGNIIKWSSLDLAGQTIGPDVGDMWYDPYHETMVMTWGDQGIDGKLWFSYAIENSFEGGWSEPVAIWNSPVPEECQGVSGDWNYQFHAHPGWDPSGETLLISYASCAQFVSFAKITWL